MNGNIKQLKFNVLLKRALRKWPPKIDLNLTKTNVGTINERYSVGDIGNTEDDISEKYIGALDEVMMRSLHSAISETIHALAVFCKQIEVNNIRDEEIKRRFERRLMNALSNDALGWLPEDKLLVNEYFFINSK